MPITVELTKNFSWSIVVTVVILLLLASGFYKGTKIGTVKSVRSLISIVASVFFTYPLGINMYKSFGPTIKSFIIKNLFHALGVEPEAIHIPEIISKTMSITASNYMNRVTLLLCITIAFTIITITSDILLTFMVSLEGLPLISTLGSFAGGLIGLGKMLLYIWIFQALVLFFGTIGVTQAYGIVQGFSQNPLLQFLTAINPIFFILKLQ